MKRSVCALFALLVLLAALPAAYAADGGSYLFDLSCDGSHTRQAVTGDIITLTLTLRRTDSQDSAPMYAMQDELCYDPAFFQLVEGSAITAASIQTAELSLRDGWRSFYMNFVSLDGDGAVWPAELPVGTVQLRVIGQSGASTVTQRSYLVSDSGGGALPVSAQDLTVVVSDSCTVRFDSCGGSPVEEQTVPLGGRVSRPRDPSRSGYTLEGWYTGSDYGTPWNFKQDVVQGNMTLYAKWTEGSAAAGGWWRWALGALAGAGLLCLLLLLGGRCQVRFDSCGGSPVAPCRVARGRPLPRPAVPVCPGHSFVGWYRDIDCTDPWDFELDAVERSITLYARWR